MRCIERAFVCLLRYSSFSRKPVVPFLIFTRFKKGTIGFLRFTVIITTFRRYSCFTHPIISTVFSRMSRVRVFLVGFFRVFGSIKIYLKFRAEKSPQTRLFSGFAGGGSKLTAKGGYGSQFRSHYDLFRFSSCSETFSTFQAPIWRTVADRWSPLTLAPPVADRGCVFSATQYQT